MNTVHSFKAVTTESEGENSLGRQFGLMSQRSLVFLWKYSVGISQKTAGTDEPLTFFIYNFCSLVQQKELFIILHSAWTLEKFQNAHI